MRRNEAVFCTVDGARFDGNEYASAMLAKTKGGGISYNFSSVGRYFSQRHRLLRERRRSS